VVIRDEEGIDLLPKSLERRKQVFFDGRSVRDAALAVNAENLLLARVLFPGQHTGLHGCGEVFGREEMVCRNALLLDHRADPSTGRIRSDHADREWGGAQGLQVEEGVPRTSEGIGVGLMGQDEDGSLPGDAAGVAEQVFV
jgi:hypothetical protein